MPILAKINQVINYMEDALDAYACLPFHTDINAKWLYVINECLQAAINDGTGCLVQPDNERTGTGTIKKFGNVSIRHDLATGFPLIGAKQVSFKQASGEKLWMMKGLTNINDLKALGGGGIWDAWAGENGELGPIYGYQWRHWDNPNAPDIRNREVDQLRNAYLDLQDDPFSRRICVTAWNPTYMPWPNQSKETILARGNMALPPCHHFFQFNVSRMSDEAALARWNAFHPDNILTDTSVVRYRTEGQPVVSNLRLDLQFNMRSNDLFLGLPYNLVGYATMLHLFAHSLGYQPGILHYACGDSHIYLNQLDVIKNMAKTACLVDIPKSKVVFKIDKSVGKPMPWEYMPKDISVEGYEHNGKFLVPVAV